MENLMMTDAVALPDGTVWWGRPGMIKTKCAYQIEDFPWDVQHCSIKLSSWAYNLDRIEIDVDYYTPNMDFQYFVENEEWIVEKKANATVAITEYATGTYQDAIFHFKFTRRSDYYVYLLWYPAAMLTVLSLFAVCIPWTIGERIGFVVTLNLTTVILMLILSDFVPKTDKLARI